MNSEDVARLRIVLGRISRQLDRQSRSAGPTRIETSMLATIARRGQHRLSALANCERPNPTMFSRVLAKLGHPGLPHRVPNPDDRRATGSQPMEECAAPTRRQLTERTRLLTRRLTALPPGRAADLLTALPALEALAAELATDSSTGQAGDERPR